MFSYRFARLSRKAIKVHKSVSFQARMLALLLLAPFFPVLGPSTVAQQVTDKTIAATTGRPHANGTSTGDLRYRIGAGDVLDIRIYNRPNLSRDAVRVEGSGVPSTKGVL